MTSKMFHAGVAAALLWTGAVHAEDAEQTQQRQHDAMHEGDQTRTRTRDPGHREAARAAMQEAMQKQMANPAGGERARAHMPALPTRRRRRRPQRSSARARRSRCARLPGSGR